MKLLVCLATLCALAIANYRVPSSDWEEQFLPEFSIRDNAFTPGREYFFHYNGQLTHGIPGSSKQYSATRIQALVSFVFKSRDQVFFKFQQVRFGRLNRKLPCARCMIPFMAFEHVTVERKLMETLMTPVKFSYVDGMINNIVFDEKEEPWSANIKRGVLNLLQVNLKQKKLINGETAMVNNKPAEEPLTPTMDFFRVFENTMEGECETLYTVTSEPHPFWTTGPVLNVTKTIKFDSCQRRPVMKYNFRFEETCPTCDPKYEEMEGPLKSSSIFRFNISGTPEAFLIEKARVESQYMFMPFNEEGNFLASFVNMTLELIKSGPIETTMPQLQNPKQSDSQLIYTPDWDILKEQFFMQGAQEFQELSPYSQVENKITFATNLLRQLVSQFKESVEERAPRVFVRLVKFMRMLKRSEIEQLHQRFFKSTPENFTPEEHMKIKDLLMDAVAFAGTKDCISHLVETIKKREISPIKAAFLVKSFVNVRVVSKEMIQELLTLSEHQVCQRNYFLKQSVFLTIGSMMKALCSENRDLLAMEFKREPEFFCPREFKEMFVQKMFEKFRSEPRWEDKLIFMKTLANAAIDLSVFDFEKMIKNIESTPIFFRAEAIVALRQLRHMMPRKIQKILMPIYMNKLEYPVLRIAAVKVLFDTLPERPILEQIARKMFSERSRQVASFVFSYLYTMANSTNPCEKKFADDMKLALRHAKYMSTGFFPGYSKFLHLPMYIKSIKSGMDVELVSIFSNTSFIPRHVSWSFNANLFGSWLRHVMRFGFNAVGMEESFWQYFGEQGHFFEKPIDELFTRFRRNAKPLNPINEMKSLFNKLRISERQFTEKDPKFYAFIKFLDQEFGFFPFSFDMYSENFNTMFREGSFNVRELESILESGYNFNVFRGAMFYEKSMKIPTPMGMPLRLSIQLPTMFSITGRVKAQIESNNKLESFKIFFEDFKPSFVSTLVWNVECWSPIVNSGVRLNSQFKLFVPFEGLIEFDTKTTAPFFRFSFKPPTRPVEAVLFQTRPLTFTRDWPKFLKTWQEPEEKTIMGEEWNRMFNLERDFPMTFNKIQEWSEAFFGVKCQVFGFWHRNPVSKIPGSPMCPFSGPNKFKVIFEPGQEVPTEFVFKVTANVLQKLQNTLKPEFEDFDTPMESHEEFSPDFQTFKSYEFQKPMKNFFKVEFFTKGGLRRQFDLESHIHFDEELRFVKFETELKRSAIPGFDSRPWMFCFKSEMLFPETPETFSELSGKKAIGQMKYSWGQSCNAEKFVTFKFQAERSERHVDNEKESPYFQQFLEQEDKTVSLYEPLYKAAFLTHYKFDIQYQNVPVFVKNVTNYFFRFFKSYYFWQTGVAQFRVVNLEKKIRADLILDPVSKQLFNLTIKMPTENTTFYDIPLPVPVYPMNIRRSFRLRNFMDLFTLPYHYHPSSFFVPEASGVPMCHVSSNRIKTFDNVEYRIPLSDCWTVLAKDCGSMEDPNFVVLMKKVNTDSELKKIKIISRYHRLVLFPESDSIDSIKVDFNGRIMTPEEFEPVEDHEHQVLRVEKENGYVTVYLPETGIKVYFDGFSANIKMSPMFRNIQCGMCGHYDLEPEDEFRSPNFQLTSDVRDFYKDYTITDGTCTFPKEISEICTSERCEYESRFDRFRSVEEQEESFPEFSEYDSKYSLEPMEVTKVIEQGNQLCFSKLPVKECPEHTYPTSYQSAKKIIFSCLPFTDPRAERFHYLALRERRVISEVEELPASFTETFSFPESCSRF